MSFRSFGPYVSVAERRARALKEMEKLRKKGKEIQPVELDGREITGSFWGKGWCDHLESFSDYDNRLPRGRAYVRNGSVCHLDIRGGRIEAIVSGSSLYKIVIQIAPLSGKTWDKIKKKCQGQIGSVLELLQGRLSDHVMAVVTDRDHGLFPHPDEIQLRCSCPDWAVMCKHVAAALYGVGNRLDHRPELLFLLRGVDAEELISTDMALPTGPAAGAESIEESALAGIFGVDIETGAAPRPATAPKARKSGKNHGQSSAREEAGAPPPSQKPKKTEKSDVKKRIRRVFNSAAPTGRGIARLRKAAGLTVPDFARALGVSTPSVQRWENTPGPLKLRARPLAALSRMQEEVFAK